MTRIAGLVSDYFSHERVELIGRMAAKMKSGESWSMRILDPIAWCGDESRSNVMTTQTEAWSVVVDGYVLNEDAGSNCASFVAGRIEERGFKRAMREVMGEVSVAAYEHKSKTLYIARDRIGLKPMYYHVSRDMFAFASRPGAILELPDVRRDVNRQFVGVFAGSHYRLVDNDPSASPYVAIRQLPAGHMLTFNHGTVEIEPYWTLRDEGDSDESEAELADQYRQLLMQAVECRLNVASNPVFTLSGGMDSATVLACAVELLNRPQQAISSTYVDKTYDESDEIADALTKVSDWHRVEIDIPDLFTLVDEMIDIHDEPVITATWLSHYLVCKRASELGFNSMFGGLGGDELNAGEYEHFFFHFADLLAAGDESGFEREVAKWVEYHNHPIFHKDIDVAKDTVDRVANLNAPGRCRPDRVRMNRYIRALNPEFFDLADLEPEMDHPFTSYLKNRTYQDMTRETIPSCMRAEDRHTVAFGIDNFVPFFDHRLVEFMWRVPGHIKIRDGVTKHLLRVATKGLLPEATRTRVTKTGWNAPAHIWFSKGFKSQLLDMVHSHRFRHRGVYDYIEVERLINEHDEIVTQGQTKDNHMMFLWQLVNLEIWFQKMVD